MDGRRWPTNGEYVESIGNADICFDDESLASGEIHQGPILGIPEGATGQNAIVLPVHTSSGKWAVRCFTTPAGDCERRYGALSEYVADLYCPSLVEAKWCTQ